MFERVSNESANEILSFDIASIRGLNFPIVVDLARDLLDSRARVKELEKWRDAVYSIVDGLDDPYVGDEWKDTPQEDCARELEHIRSVLVPLVRGEEER